MGSCVAIQVKSTIDKPKSSLGNLKNDNNHLISTVSTSIKQKKTKDQKTQIEDFINQLLIKDTKKDKEFSSSFDITCDFCQSSDVGNPIYKCTKCRNYSLCFICYEKRKVSVPHEITHQMICLKNTELNNNLNFKIFNFDLGLTQICMIAREFSFHKDIKCNYCKDFIQGIRFYCDHEQCNNYLSEEEIEYNLCDECHFQGKYNVNHKLDHPILLQFTPIIYNFIDGQQLFKNDKNKLMSLKITFKHEKEKLSIINERNLIKNCNSPYYVKYYGCFIENENIFFYYENMEGKKTLYEIIDNREKIDLLIKFKICLQLVSALRRLHSKNIFHLKLNPKMIYIINDKEKTNIKIHDSIVIYDNNNIEYLEFNETSNLDSNSDIYSFGLIMNEIFTNEFHDNYKDYFIQKKSKFFYNIIEKCILVEKKKRPKAEEIEDYFLKFLAFYNSNLKNFTDLIEKQNYFQTTLMIFEEFILF